MTKTEKKKWLKALDETERIWSAAIWRGAWIRGRTCPLCVATDRLGGGCIRCIYLRTFGLDKYCIDVIRKAYLTHSRRPVYDAIRKIRKWVEAQ